MVWRINNKGGVTINNLTESEATFLKEVLPICNAIGNLSIKKSIFGGQIIQINKIKIGGIIADSKTGLIFQIKPTKKGEQIILNYSKKYQGSLPFSGNTPNFTLIRLDNVTFLNELIQATYAELNA